MFPGKAQLHCWSVENAISNMINLEVIYKPMDKSLLIHDHHTHVCFFNISFHSYSPFYSYNNLHSTGKFFHYIL